MVDSTLVARARKARYDNLPNFSGHPSEDAERFLKSVKNITKANDESTDQQFLEIVRGKLTQTACIWFDDNESQFTKWSDFEIAFRNRYFSTTMIRTKFDKLTQRKQQHDESVTSYFDAVVALCREIDPNMSDTVIIQYLMSGINPKFQRELSRRESPMRVLADFLKYAKIEQDLYDTYERSQESTVQPAQPYFAYHLSSSPQHTTTIQQQEQYYRHPNHRNRRSYPTTTTDLKQNRNQQIAAAQNQRMPNRSALTPKFDACKVCGRYNHRSIDCTHKRPTGCYNCGQNHSVRDCSKPPHFQ
jgi:hypothetical protein